MSTDDSLTMAHAVRVTFGTHEFSSLPTPRALRPWEREMVQRVVESDSTLGLPGNRQAVSLSVVEECSDCPTVMLSPERKVPVIPRADNQGARFGAVGAGFYLAGDLDGVPIFAVLHIREGVISELEVARMDGEAIQRLPEPDEFHPAPDDG